MDSFDEDGEVRDDQNHPNHLNEEQLHDDDEFSMSSYDGEQTDSLIIKPPQAVVQHRDKREKREKREKHRHKGERHKDRRYRNREQASGHEERRREHRRHRNRDAERREGKRHDKRRERSPKHERPSGDLRNKLEKDRKINEREQKRRREKARERDEFYIDDRDLFDFRPRDQHSSRGGNATTHHRGDRRQDERAILMQGALMDLQLSPREKAEKEKRMERFMAAEKQKEITQRNADARRQKREEERREEKRMIQLRHRAEASMLRNAARNASPRRKRKHGSRPLIEPETVELISDDEDNLFLEAVKEEEEEEKRRERRRKKRKKEEVLEEEEEEEEIEEEEEKEEEEGGEVEEKAAHEASARSSSSGQTSDSDSSSNSSSDDDDEGDDDANDDENKDKDPSSTQGKKSPSSASSTDDTADDDKRDSDNDSGPDDYLDESPAASPLEMKEQLPFYYPAIMGCRSVDEFECLNRIEEGTYGVVYRAREKATNEIVALKRLKMEKEKEGFPITSLREVNTLLKGQHENIVTVREIVVGSNMDKIYIVMDYVEHDLKSLMETMRKKKQTFTIGEIKTMMLQLLSAVHHLHDNWILHRDLKTSNLLLSHRGIIKVGDFGLAREYGSPLKQYTPIVVTLWYRAPELLLGAKEYSCPIDVWSLGCIFGELLGMEPMFPGKSEIDQLNKIFKDLGTPSEKIWPGYSQLPVIKKTQFANYPFNNLKERFKSRLSIEGFNLLNSFLTYNPAKRITCSDGMEHDYFYGEEPAPIDPAMFPTWPAKSENPHGAKGTKKEVSPKPPSGGKYFKDLGDGEDANIAGFFLGGAPSSGPGFTLKF